MTSSCYILDVADNIESLLALQVDEVTIAKGGGGAGVVNSRIRASCERLKKGPLCPGPLAFMKARDAWAGVMLCGDVVRGFPMMEVLHYTHPDIRDFIQTKAQEEAMSRSIGPAYRPSFQNSNFSVRVDQSFWDKYYQDDSISLKSVQGERVVAEHRAREILSWIALAAHACGDPGVQYEDTIYRWMTVDGDPAMIGANPLT